MTVRAERGEKIFVSWKLRLITGDLSFLSFFS